jgi:hypothetical protein
MQDFTHSSMGEIPGSPMLISPRLYQIVLTSPVTELLEELRNAVRLNFAKNGSDTSTTVTVLT